MPLSSSVAEELRIGLIPGNYHWNLAVMYASGDEPWTLFENAPLFVVLPEDGRCDG